MPWPFRHDSPEGRYLYLKEEQRLRDEEANDDANDLRARDRYYEEQRSLEEERYRREQEERERELDLEREREERERELERERFE